jgi:hypothetical protein
MLSHRSLGLFRHGIIWRYEMKKLFGGFLALCASAALAATTVPVQLINPAGSTAGQAILSTGASTAPAWGPVALSGVTGTLAVANGGTGATSAAAARTNLGAAATASPLSQFASTTSAQLASIISDETGSGSLVFAGSPTFTGTVSAAALSASGLITPTSSIGIAATKTNDSPAAGSVGEQMTAAGSGISLANNTPTNCTSVNLTPGEWTVYGQFAYLPSGATATTLSAGASTTSVTLPGAPDAWLLQSSALGTGNQTGTIPMRNFKFTSTTQVFLVVQANFPSGTATATCRIFAWRPR